MRPEAVTHLAIATMRLDAITTAVAAASLAASGLTVPGLPALPPAPRTPEDLQRRTTIDAALRRAWTGLDGFSTATPEEDAAIDAVSGENGNTYGEVTFDGARCVFDALGLYDAPAGAVFADLGSGVGQMVAHCAVECAVAGSVGVELSRSRHDRAVEALKRLSFDDDVDAAALKTVDLREGDILAELPRLDRVSHAYCASLLFDDPMLARLGAALDASNVESFAALSSVPTKRFVQDGAPRRARMTWNPAGGGSDVFVYRRRKSYNKFHFTT